MKWRDQSNLCPYFKQLRMWTGILKTSKEVERKRRKQGQPLGENERDEGKHIPSWFEKYIVYKFNLYDRAGMWTYIWFIDPL